MDADFVLQRNKLASELAFYEEKQYPIELNSIWWLYGIHFTHKEDSIRTTS